MFEGQSLLGPMTEMGMLAAVGPKREGIRQVTIIDFREEE